MYGSYNSFGGGGNGGFGCGPGPGYRPSAGCGPERGKSSYGGSTFVLIVVLFILLIIVGKSFIDC